MEGKSWFQGKDLYCGHVTFPQLWGKDLNSEFAFEQRKYKAITWFTKIKRFITNQE